MWERWHSGSTDPPPQNLLSLTDTGKGKLALRSDPTALPSLLLYALFHASLSQCAASSGSRDQSRARSAYDIYLLMTSTESFGFQHLHDRSVRVSNSCSFDPTPRPTSR